VLACHAKIVRQLLFFSIEMLIYLENILFLIIMYCISCFIHNILCETCCWFSQGSVIGRASDLLRAGWSGVRMPLGGGGGGGVILHSCPDLQPSQPHVRRASGHFLRGEAWCWCPPSSSAKVKERVELYLYFHTGPSWLVLGWTLPYCRSLLIANSALLWGWPLRQQQVKLNTSKQVTNEMGLVKIRTWDTSLNVKMAYQACNCEREHCLWCRWIMWLLLIVVVQNNKP
jgi:hypothetical protein